eukprot:gnl/MRDRNA2_/MRDRNA2_40392_c0_seq1.p1 gnl/MRDRNA2_/MRDRNA2_40392_c0~~gnl/MRDRNA2_/MRDRNA2_40392_c0_seq1.p1  ORF type:complete len:583 (-),score=97.13 gnl/MRDRNA2_/MRDRNA2_40392_c0_seq1:560-2122(-)
MPGSSHSLRVVEEELYQNSLMHVVTSMATKHTKASGDRTEWLRSTRLLLQQIHCERKLQQILSNRDVVACLIAGFREDPDPMLLDPLTSLPFSDPVVISSGMVVDRQSVFGQNGEFLLDRCPWTGQELRREVFPVVLLKNKVQEWKTEMLEFAVEIGILMVSYGQSDDADKLLQVAERFLDGADTVRYMKVVKRFCELERQCPSASAPDRYLAIHQRLFKVSRKEERACIVQDALFEILERADVKLKERDVDGASAWLNGDLSEWLRKPEVSPYWTSLYYRWASSMLRLAEAEGNEHAVWDWRRTIYNHFDTVTGSLPETPRELSRSMHGMSLDCSGVDSDTGNESFAPSNTAGGSAASNQAPQVNPSSRLEPPASAVESDADSYASKWSGERLLNFLSISRSIPDGALVAKNMLTKHVPKEASSVIEEFVGNVEDCAKSEASAGSIDPPNGKHVTQSIPVMMIRHNGVDNIHFDELSVATPAGTDTEYAAESGSDMWVIPRTPSDVRSISSVQGAMHHQ